MALAGKRVDSDRFARCVAVSKRVQWDIDHDVIKSRRFSRGEKFLPDGLSKVDAFSSLSADERRYLSQIEGRTYANIFGLVERYITAKILELSRDHWLGDQNALEALVRFSQEELKHQALFRRVEQLAAEQLPAGYTFAWDPDKIAKVVLSKGSFAVLLLTLHIELFTQLHYKESIEPDSNLSPLFKDIFLYHWKEESQHAIIDELELHRLSEALTPQEKDRGVVEFIELVQAVDGILQAQAEADARYFAQTNARPLSETELKQVQGELLKAYRWQYITSGAQHPPFVKVLKDLLSEQHLAQISAALQTLA